MSLQTNDIYQFADFRLDRSEKTLHRGGNAVPLAPKIFETLCVLVESAGHLIEKDVLMQKLWQDRFVEESNLTYNIKMLRKAIGDNAQNPQFIETVPSRGYRFIAKVNVVKGLVTEPVALADGAIALSSAPIANSPGAEPFFDATAALPVVKPRPSSRVFLFTIGFASAISLILLLSFNYRTASSFKPNDVKSIAVLPVKPLSPENREPIYELGIADSLILKLSAVKGLIVLPLSATRQYADMAQDPIAAGKEQQVDYVLASNYQIDAGKFRLTSQLINVHSGLVEDVFKVELENSGGFALQDAVAANISRSLLKRLNREPNDLLAKRYTDNEEAYRLYLQGTALADKRSQADARKAVEQLEQAVRLDPNYALAYAGLGHAHSVLAATRGEDHWDEEYGKAKAAIEKALAIDPNLAEAHSYLGEIRLKYDWDFAGAEREHKQAVELNPNSADGHRLYAHLLSLLGRADESIAEIKIAIDLEPGSVVNHHVYGSVLYFARRYPEAIVEAKRTLELDPEFFPASRVLTSCYRLIGDDDRAFEALVQRMTIAEKPPDEIKAWKAIYAESGWRGVSLRELEEVKADEKRGKPNYGQMAGVSTNLGQIDAAFAYLDKAVTQRRQTIITLKVNPGWDSLRSDPRFDELLRRVGLK